MITRLKDPKGLVSEAERISLEEKISECLGKMARSTDKGGNPFFFTLAATKYHYLEDNIGIKGWETAATDGVIYIWHPNFLRKLDSNKVRVVQMHESMHVICRHCDRFEGKNPKLWRLATDYYVNYNIEKEYIDSKKIIVNKNPNGEAHEHPLWNGELGTPISLNELKERIKSNHENPDQIIDEKKAKEKRCCADISLVGKSADDIYNELYEQYKKYPPPVCDDPNCDHDHSDDWEEGIDGLDEHLPTKLTKREIQRQLMHAAETAKRMRGNIPSDVVEELKHLQEPQLTWQDLCHRALARCKEKNGRLNNWTRFRKRGLSLGVYIPTKMEFNGKILVLLDTSGSMSADDYTYGVSQLKALDGHSSCWVVPTDATPHWDHAVEVKNANDLKNVKIVGRGGTVFDEFFRDYNSKMKRHGPFDLIIVITDGGFGSVDLALKPKCEVVWVATNSYDIKPPFGFTAPLRQARKD